MRSLLFFLAVFGFRKIRLNLESIDTENFHNLQYYTYVRIGRSNFSVIVDTGSYVLWVPSVYAQCKCSKYDPQINQDYLSYGKQGSVTYMGGHVEGEYSSDILRIGNFSTRLEFLLVFSIENLSQLASDGILGLGFKGKSSAESNLINSLYRKSQISEPVFSIDFNSNKEDSYLIIGGSERKYSESGKKVVKVFSDFFSWSGTCEKVKFGDVEIEDYSVVFFDTGLSSFVGPAGQVDRIFQYIQGILSECSEGKFLSCKCGIRQIRQLPDLVFEIQGNRFRVRPENYLRFDGHYCLILIMKSGSMSWGAGMGFFREYYSVFNYSDATVSFYDKEVQAGKAGKFGWVLGTAGLFVVILFAVNRKKSSEYIRIN